MSDPVPVEAVANLQLDEVTGERVSKSEFKRRQKQRAVEKQKAEKAAAAAASGTKAVKKSKEEEELNLSPNVRLFLLWFKLLLFDNILTAYISSSNTSKSAAEKSTNFARLKIPIPTHTSSRSPMI